MLEVGSKSRFVSIDGRSIYGIIEVLKFYELIGINYLYIDIINPIDTNYQSTISSIVNSRRISSTIADLEKTIIDNSFRIEMIIIYNERNFTIDTSFTKLPVILIESLSDNKNKFDYVYRFSVDEKLAGTKIGQIGVERGLSKYLVEDIHNNWKTSLEELRIKYIRNKKLEDLFGLNDI